MDISSSGIPESRAGRSVIRTHGRTKERKNERTYERTESISDGGDAIAVYGFSSFTEQPVVYSSVLRMRSRSYGFRCRILRSLAVSEIGSTRIGEMPAGGAISISIPRRARYFSERIEYVSLFRNGKRNDFAAQYSVSPYAKLKIRQIVLKIYQRVCSISRREFE